MTVNAVVTGLIVFRIIKVFQEVKTAYTVDGGILGATGGGTLWHVIFVLIESGMGLFSIHLAWLVVVILGSDTAIEAFDVPRYRLLHLSHIIKYNSPITSVT